MSASLSRMCISRRARYDLSRKKRSAAIPPASTGQTIHAVTMVMSDWTSVCDPVKRFHPTIPPTMACVTETGRPALVIHRTARPAARATMKEPPRAFTEPRSSSVAVAPAPDSTAPRMTNIPQTIAAVVNLTIRVATAVPNTFAATFAPRDQPRKMALVR